MGSNRYPRRSSIRRLIASEFMTLDGVMEAPGYDEHPDGKNTCRINALPKYVVSKTLKDVEWENSTLLSGDIVDDVRRLKEQPGGDT